MKKTLISPFIIAVLSFIIFFLLPNYILLFVFSGKQFYAGELWRLFTFPFTHTNIIHLLQNLMALAVLTILAYEFELEFNMFNTVFLLSSFGIALTAGILSPEIYIAGASLGLYAVLGYLALKGANFISKYITIPVFLASIFIDKIPSGFISLFSDLSLIFHLLGFISGILIFIIASLLKEKRIYILQNE